MAINNPQAVRPLQTEASTRDSLYRLCSLHGITMPYEDEQDGVRAVPDETLAGHPASAAVMRAMAAERSRPGKEVLHENELAGRGGRSGS